MTIPTRRAEFQNNERTYGVKLSPGCFIRAIGRDFTCSTDAEAYARAYMAEEGNGHIHAVTLFLTAPGCLPVKLWTVMRR